MEIKNISKSYGNLNVYSHFNLSVEDNKITCILGESGSGKTTLLNIIAGLTDYSGYVDKVTCSYIFQTPRLVPNLTVTGNLKLVEKDEFLICSDRRALKIRQKIIPKACRAGRRRGWQ
jgi:NitT/TauT family transport system ATP-binding protein